MPDPADRSHLPTEARLAASMRLDAMSTPDALAVMNQQDALAVAAVAGERERVAAAIDLVVNGLRAGGRLFYIGAGTSGRLGVLDASECPPTFGTDPGQVQGIIAGGEAAMFRSQEGAEDDAGAGAAEIARRGVDARDVVIGIAAGGTTPFVHGALRAATAAGAATVFISCVPPVPGEPGVDVVIRPVTGPEVVTGSTRLKAGTATKLVLNQITTLSMVRLGKVHENLMVDLRAGNAKLLDRARRMTALLTGLPPGDAAAMLASAGGQREDGRGDAPPPLRPPGGPSPAGRPRRPPARRDRRVIGGERHVTPAYSARPVEPLMSQSAAAQTRLVARQRAAVARQRAAVARQGAAVARQRAAVAAQFAAVARERATLLARIRRQYDVTEERIAVGPLRVPFLLVSDPDAVLDAVCDNIGRIERETGQKVQSDAAGLPYWAELWESAIGLGQQLVETGLAERGFPGDRITHPQPPSVNVLDLGCGMGLSGAVAAMLGGRVTFADLEPACLLFARYNGLLHRPDVRARRLDWQTDQLGERFDVILGSDVLYERTQWQHLEPFFCAHLAPGGRVLLGEPGRQSGEAFVQWIAQYPGWHLTHRQQRVPTRSAPIRLFELTLGP